MEYIDGVSPDETERLEELGLSGKVVAEELCRLFGDMIFCVRLFFKTGCGTVQYYAPFTPLTDF